jgi:hypothetical protein
MVYLEQLFGQSSVLTTIDDTSTAADKIWSAQKVSGEFAGLASVYAQVNTSVSFSGITLNGVDLNDALDAKLGVTVDASQVATVDPSVIQLLISNAQGSIYMSADTGAGNFGFNFAGNTGGGNLGYKTANNRISMMRWGVATGYEFDATPYVGTNAIYHQGNKPTKIDVGLANVDNTSDANKPVSTAVQAALDLKIDTTKIGAVNGVASLDASGLVPASQLPSFVDDVLEYANQAAFPGTGVSGKIYVALDTGKTYRWSGSAYTEISASPGSTDAVTEGTTNKYYTDARVRACVLTGLADTAGTPAAADSILVAFGKIKKGFFTDHAGVGGSVHANAVAGGAAGFMTGADKTKLDGVAAGATANATDAQLRDRATHTGTQTASTISDLSETVYDLVAAILTPGTNVTLNEDDTTNTITVNSSGGGGSGGLSDGDYGDVLVSGASTALTVQSAAGDFAVGGNFSFRGGSNSFGPISGTVDNNVYWETSNAYTIWTFRRWSGGTPTNQAGLTVADSGYFFDAGTHTFRSLASATYATIGATGLTVTGLVDASSTIVSRNGAIQSDTTAGNPAYFRMSVGGVIKAYVALGGDAKTVYWHTEAADGAHQFEIGTAQLAKIVPSGVTITPTADWDGSYLTGAIRIAQGGAAQPQLVIGGSASKADIQSFNSLPLHLNRQGNTVYINNTDVLGAINGKIAATEKGAANGVATLDSSGLVPSTQLPSYVDDVLEYANLASFPGTGTTGKIYVALDTGKTYRWSGSAYVEISASPGSTDAVTEGTVNKYYTDARVRACALTGFTLTAGNVTATDSVLVAFGKIQQQISDNAAAIAGKQDSGSYAVLSAAENVFSGMVRAQTPNSGTTGGIRLMGDATSGYAYLQVTNTGASAEWGYIRWNSTGDAYMNGTLTVNGNITSNSDARLKTNIRPLDGGLEKVTQLRGTRFEKNGREEIGVIAQEIEEVLPELVVTSDDEMGTKSVAYDRLTAVLIEAVKELSAKVDAQAAEIAELKAAR